LGPNNDLSLPNKSETFNIPCSNPAINKAGNIYSRTEKSGICIIIKILQISIFLINFWFKILIFLLSFIKKYT